MLAVTHAIDDDLYVDLFFLAILAHKSHTCAWCLFTGKSSKNYRICFQPLGVYGKSLRELLVAIYYFLYLRIWICFENSPQFEVQNPKN